MQPMVEDLELSQHSVCYFQGAPESLVAANVSLRVAIYPRRSELILNDMSFQNNR